MAESVFPACHALTPSLNTGTQNTRRQTAMSSLHCGASARAFVKAVSAPVISFVSA